MEHFPENTLVSQRVRQFDTKHGDNGIAINGWLIFADGAKREAHNLQGSLMEPPKDPQECEKIQLHYQEEMLRRATENVQRKKQAVVQKTREKSPVEKHQEFDKKHSKDGPGIQDGGFVTYPDGAYRDTNAMGVLAEPYDDPWNPLLLEKKIVRYWVLTLKHATDRFTEQRDSWLKRAKGNLGETVVPGPPEIPTAAVRRLKVMKKSVQKAQAKLDEARKLLEDAKPKSMIQRQETSSKHRSENAEFAEAVEKINI
jgi:hypothetical protein